MKQEDYLDFEKIIAEIDTKIEAVRHVENPQGFNVVEELARLEKEKKAAEKDIQFLSGKLNNQGFLSKAPAQQIENERAKLAKAEEKMKKINESIAALK